MSDVLDEALNYQPYNAFKDGPLVAKLAAEIATLREALAAEKAARVEAERLRRVAEALSVRNDDQFDEMTAKLKAAEARALALEARVEEMAGAVVAEVERLRPHYLSQTATDIARRQMLDHFAAKFPAVQPQEPTLPATAEPPYPVGHEESPPSL